MLDFPFSRKNRICIKKRSLFVFMWRWLRTNYLKIYEGEKNILPRTSIEPTYEKLKSFADSGVSWRVWMKCSMKYLDCKYQMLNYIIYISIHIVSKVFALFTPISKLCYSLFLILGLEEGALLSAIVWVSSWHKFWRNLAPIARYVSNPRMLA